MKRKKQFATKPIWQTFENGEKIKVKNMAIKIKSITSRIFQSYFCFFLAIIVVCNVYFYQIGFVRTEKKVDNNR